MDSDVHKWLEALGWTLADPDLAEDDASRLRDLLDQTEELLRAAQEPDGYLDSHFQVRFPGERFVQLPWGHELYCAGHLIQAAVAVHRGTGDDRILQIARRVADLVVRSFGTGTARSTVSAATPRSRRPWSSSTARPTTSPISTPLATSSTAVATVCSATATSAGTTGRTTPRSARRTRSKATRSVSSTCSPASPTW